MRNLEITFTELRNMAKPIIVNFYKNGYYVFKCCKTELCDIEQEIYLELWKYLQKNDIPEGDELRKIANKIINIHLIHIFNSNKREIRKHNKLYRNILKRDNVKVWSHKPYFNILAMGRLFLKGDDYLILKKYLEGSSYREIGNFFCCSNSNIYNKLQQILKKFKI